MQLFASAVAMKRRALARHTRWDPHTEGRMIPKAINQVSNLAIMSDSYLLVEQLGTAVAARTKTAAPSWSLQPASVFNTFSRD